MNEIKFLVFIMILGTMTPFEGQSRTITLAADPWCPMTCEGTPGQQGFMTDVARQVLKLEGVEMDYQVMPWAQALEQVRIGKIDGVIGALHNDAPDFIFPNTSFANQESCFFSNQKSTWSYKGVSSLKGVNLGLVSHYAYGPELDDYLKHAAKDLNLDYVSGTDTTSRLFQKLNLGRIDVVIEDKSVASYQMAKAQNKDSFKMVGCLAKSPLYIAFSPKDQKKGKDLADIFEKGLQKLIKAKQVGPILKDYGL